MRKTTFYCDLCKDETEEDDLGHIEIRKPGIPASKVEVCERCITEIKKYLAGLQKNHL